MKEAIIFDMDGVISDTQIFHAAAESLVLKKYGIDLEPDRITDLYAGVSDDEMFADIFINNNMPELLPAEAVVQKWQNMQKLATGKIRPIPHAARLIKELHESGLLLAVASSSPMDFIEEVLEELSLRQYFHALASAEEVAQSKPAPDVFLLAAQRLGVSPEQAVVIEDGRSGMESARRAGMYCIGLVSDVTDRSYPADTLVNSLADVQVNHIKAL